MYLLLNNHHLDIVYEDRSIIIVDKPPGVVIHPGNKYRQADTLVHILRQKFSIDQLSTIAGSYRPGIVHRLDQDTSGLMVVSKSNAVHLNLSQQISLRHLKRIYIAVTWGVPKEARGTIITQVQQHPNDCSRMTVVNSGGKIAVTHYNVIATAINNCFSVIQCELETGKTHQIRLHMNYIGHPIIGDQKYGIDIYKMNRLLPLMQHNSCLLSQYLVNFTRQALHSCYIAFTHPTTYQRIVRRSALPVDIKKLLQYTGMPITYDISDA